MKWWASATVAVDAARRIARQLGVSGLLIGLTVTSIGTSLPEIATNIAAALSVRGGVEASGIAVGNVIGSCLVQISLLLGVTALISPMAVPREAIRRDSPMLLVAMAAMFAACVDGVASRLDGLLLIGLYAAYLGWLFRQQARATSALSPEGPAEPPPPIRLPLELLKGAAGLAGLVLCAGVLVDSGVEMARGLGVSDGLIGIFVGVGTCLPELSVALRAAWKGAPDLSLGNLIGSNITDPLLSFGAGAAVHDLAIEPTAMRFDFPFWAALTVVAVLLMWERADLTRREGGALVVLFVLFAYLRLVA